MFRNFISARISPCRSSQTFRTSTNDFYGQTKKSSAFMTTRIWEEQKTVSSSRRAALVAGGGGLDRTTGHLGNSMRPRLLPSHNAVKTPRHVPRLGLHCSKSAAMPRPDGDRCPRDIWERPDPA